MSIYFFFCSIYEAVACGKRKVKLFRKLDIESQDTKPKDDGQPIPSNATRRKRRKTAFHPAVLPTPLKASPLISRSRS